jgi:hypothetical protein
LPANDGTRFGSWSRQAFCKTATDRIGNQCENDRYCSCLPSHRCGGGRVLRHDYFGLWRQELFCRSFQRKEAIKRRAAGETLAEIAKSYAVDISMISRLAPGFLAPFESDDANAAA